MNVLYFERAHLPSLEAQRTNDQTSDRQHPDGRGSERQSADRNRADGCCRHRLSRRTHYSTTLVWRDTSGHFSSALATKPGTSALHIFWTRSS